jgi:hypothetical protein
VADRRDEGALELAQLLFHGERLAQARLGKFARGDFILGCTQAPHEGMHRLPAAGLGNVQAGEFRVTVFLQGQLDGIRVVHRGGEHMIAGSAAPKREKHPESEKCLHASIVEHCRYDKEPASWSQ